MDKIEDMIKALNEADEEDRKKVKDISNALREMADSLDELVAEGKTAEEIETIVGKIIIKFVKIQGLLT